MDILSLVGPIANLLLTLAKEAPEILDAFRAGEADAEARLRIWADNRQQLQGSVAEFEQIAQRLRGEA